jgi:hypothetical protein
MVSRSANRSILDDLAARLAGTSLKVLCARQGLTVRHEHFSTHVDIVALDDSDSPLGSITFVVQIRSDLSDEMAQLITENRSKGDSMNRLATLGALTFDSDRPYVGSRLTIFEFRDAWNIEAPLVLMSIIGAAESILGGTGRALMVQTDDSDSGASAWTESDFERVEATFLGQCVCMSDEQGFTAEFPLRPEAGSAMAGDSATALWKITSDEPHPAVGSGIFCMLQLPHQVPDESRLSQVLRQLNQVEMQPHPLPPHFGAWCAGTLGRNPAYVSFLPNALHEAVPGIAVNLTAWAAARAQWANITLASLGVVAGP